jgi:hypothetical protein
MNYRQTITTLCIIAVVVAGSAGQLEAAPRSQTITAAEAIAICKRKFGEFADFKSARRVGNHWLCIGRWREMPEVCVSAEVHGRTLTDLRIDIPCVH